MQTQTFYRKANVESAKAIASIKRRFPKSELVDFQKKVAEDQGEAVAAQAKIGDEIYVASIRTAEFPPSEDDSESAPAEESDSDDSAPEPSESDDEGSDSEDAAPAFGGEDSGEGEEPKKLSPEEETNHLLRQILDALKGGGAPGDELGPGGPGDELGLPDIGAPEPGLGGGLPAPGGPKPPLPPPIKEKKPIGGPSFASFNANADVQVAVRDVEDDTTVASVKQEAEEFWPTHKVAKIQWTGSRDNKKAKVILVKR